MNLLHLKYFYVVARERGFTKASQALRIQQPAISRMVGQLEDHFGFPLFERIGRGVQLTGRGQEVFERCKRIFAEVDELERSIGSLSGECQGPLAFAAAEPIASHFVPDVIQKLLKQHPKVYPIVNSGPAGTLFDQLLDGRLEFGLFFHIPELPAKLEATTLKKVRFRLVVAKEHRRTKSVLRSFIGSREVDDRSTSRFPTLERLKKDVPEAKITISSNNLTAHKEMVLAGLGVSVLPDFLVGKELESGLLVDVYPKEKFEFNLKLVQRSSSVPTLNARSFIRLCLEN